MSEYHTNADTDFEASSLHHTIGRGPTQAARGNHNHFGEYSPFDHEHTGINTIGMVIMFLGDAPPTSEYLLLNGQSITRAEYSNLFVVLNVPPGTNVINLPDYRGRFPVGADGTAHKLNKHGGPVDTSITVPISATTDVNLDSVVTDVTGPDIVVTNQPISATTDINPDLVVTDANVEPRWTAVNFFVKVA